MTFDRADDIEAARRAIRFSQPALRATFIDNAAKYAGRHDAHYQRHALYRR